MSHTNPNTNVNTPIVRTPNNLIATPTVTANVSPTNSRPSDLSSLSNSVPTCKDCGNPLASCHERIYRDFCLQTVMDHFEDDGIRFTDELGVYTTFIKAYTLSVKKDLLTQHGYYDRQREIQIPGCMINGSLKDAQSLRTTDCLRRQLLDQRVFDVEIHVQQLQNGEISQPAPSTYDRIVREI